MCAQQRTEDEKVRKKSARTENIETIEAAVSVVHILLSKRVFPIYTVDVVPLTSRNIGAETRDSATLLTQPRGKIVNINDMERVKSKRTTQRALHTRLRTEARQLIDSNQLSLSALRVLHDRLKTCNDGLQKLNEQLEAFLTDEQTAEDFALVSEYEDNAAASLALLRHHIESLQAPGPPARGIDQQNEDLPLSPSAQQNDHGDHGGPGRVGARLPKLELPRFDGTVSQWQPFWDMFCHTVHENNHLTNIDRYHYLKTLLSGPAAKAIAGIQVSEASYCVAIEILKNRFGSVKIIQQTYLANLRTLKPVKSSGDVTELRELLDSVQINVRGLKALGLAGLTQFRWQLATYGNLENCTTRVRVTPTLHFLYDGTIRKRELPPK
ncbi:hypothetical protein ISCGN_019524 [Ixodes scapularis]